MEPPNPIALPALQAVLSRRQFLGLGSLGSLAMAMRLRGQKIDDPYRELDGLRYNDPLAPLIFPVNRAHDLLRLDVELINFMPVRQRGFVSKESPVMTGASRFDDRFTFHIASYARPGYVVLHFGGQHLAEQAIWDRPIVAGASAPPEVKRSPTFLLNRKKGSLRNDDLAFLRRGRFRAKEGGGGEEPEAGMTGGLAGAWLAGHSQVVFEVPQRYAPLPFDFDLILELCLSRCSLRVHPCLAEEAPPGTFFTGSDHESVRLERPYLGNHDTIAPHTRIEFPSLLYISPYENARFRLSRGLGGGGKRAELWSLSMEPPDPMAPQVGRPRELRRPGHMFAIDCEQRPGRWPLELRQAVGLGTDDQTLGEGKSGEEEKDSNKYSGTECPKTTLYQATRGLLVGQMREDNGDIRAERFRLTSLGASAHLEYRPLFSPQLKKATKAEKTKQGEMVADGISTEVEDENRKGFLTEWIQKTELGRDYYVKEAFAGWWMPFQLPAESVTITERIFSAVEPPAPDDDPAKYRQTAQVEANLTAFLVARKFALVKERMREFGNTESDDFDNAGAMIARAMGLRKIEILVDRTPTLSNHGSPGDLDPTQANPELFARIRNGEDGVFVAGGEGKYAGQEVFWPRVAVVDDSNKSPRRNLTAYRFPVRLTFIDGAVRETHFPMFFCYDRTLGAALYGEAPADLRSLPVNDKVVLATPQPAGAINTPDLAVEDCEALKAYFANNKALPINRDLMNHGPQSTDALSRMASTVLGGVREQIFDHVAGFNGALDEWIGGKIVAPIAKDQLRESIRKLVFKQPDQDFQNTVSQLLGLNDDDDRESFVRRIMALIAWGAEANAGVDAARAMQRLGTAVELIRTGETEVDKKAEELWNHLKGAAALAKGQATQIQALLKSLGEALPGVKTFEELEKQLPKLQVQWIARLGADWRRAEWDEWFAQLFVLAGSAGKGKPCWHGPLMGVLQKAHVNALINPSEELKKLIGGGLILPWTAGKDELIRTAFKPIAELNLNDAVPHFANPGKLGASIGDALKLLEEDAVREGVSAVRRLKGAIESALPDERLLRQRAQQLAEDFDGIMEKGKSGMQTVRRELTAILADAGTQLTHITAHVDGGIRQTRRFMEDAAGTIDRVASSLGNVENSAKALADERSACFTAAAGAIDASVPRFVKFLLESNPAQALVQFQNLLHETGGRLAVEVEEGLLGLGDVLAAADADLAKLVTSIQNYKRAVAGGDHVMVARIRMEVLKHRQQRERLLEEVRGLTGAWRGMLKSLLDKFFEAVPAEVEALELVKEVKEFYDGLIAGKGMLCGRLASRVADLLSRLRPEQGLPAAVQKRFAEVEAALEEDLAEGWTAREATVNAALAVLVENGKQASEQLQAEIEKLKKAVDADLASVGTRLDDVEHVMAKLLQGKREERQKVLRQMLRLIGGSWEGELAGYNVELEKLWNGTLGDDLKKIQAKFGQSVGDLKNGGEAIKKEFGAELDRITATTKKVLGDIQRQIEGRRAHLEGAGRTLVHKAQMALQCPSLVKSFRDQSAKASYHVEQFVVGMSALRASEAVAAQIGDRLKQGLAGKLGADPRTAMGFPALEAMKVRIPNLDGVQTIKHAARYVSDGLRGAEKEVAGTFAELVKEAGSIAQESGLADAVGKINCLSRDLGGVANSLKEQMGELGKVANAAKEVVGDLEKVRGQAEAIYKAKEGQLKDAAKILQDDIKGQIKATEKKFRDAVSEKKAAIKQTLDEKKKALTDSIEKEKKDLEDAFNARKKQIEQAAENYKKDIEDNIRERVGDIKEMVEQQVADFIPAGASKLLGVLPMKDILQVIGSPDKAPQMLANRLPDRVERTFVWENEAKELSLPGGLLKFAPGENNGVPSKLRVRSITTVWVPKPGQPPRMPEVFVRGHLDAFALTIAGMLKIDFRSVSFTVNQGKFDFKPSLGRAKDGGGGAAPTEGGGDSFLTFMGPLEVVDDVRKTMMAFIAGKSGPVISIDGSWIRAGYAIALPALTMGAVTIANISLSVHLALPLKSGPLTFLFKLCDRFEPFRVAVFAFTGGGYLGVQVSPDRQLCWVEGSIEFGGSLSFNVAVAQGELYLMAGAYFRMEHAGVTFSGYLRAGGRATILGVLEVTILFYLALFYRKLRGGSTEFWGQCTVSIRIKLGFFKKTVRVTMEKHFAGSKSTSGEEDEGGAAFLDKPYGADRLLVQNNGGAGAGPAVISRVGYAEDYTSKEAWADYWDCFAYVAKPAGKPNPVPNPKPPKPNKQPKRGKP